MLRETSSIPRSSAEYTTNHCSGTFSTKGDMRYIECSWAGDVTVLWSLPGGAGQLRSSYRILLTQRENRWLLQEITPAVGTP